MEGENQTLFLDIKGRKEWRPYPPSPFIWLAPGGFTSKNQIAWNWGMFKGTIFLWPIKQNAMNELFISSIYKPSVNADIVCERGIFPMQLNSLIANQSLNCWNKAYQQYKQDLNVHDCWYLAVTASPTERRPDCLEQGSEFSRPSLYFAQNAEKQKVRAEMAFLPWGVETLNRAMVPPAVGWRYYNLLSVHLRDWNTAYI